MRRIALLAALAALLLVACGGDDDVSAADFCEDATRFEQRFEQLDAELSGGEVPSPDVFEEAADAIDDLAGDAPGQIRDDLVTVADGVREVAEVLGEVDLDDPDLLDDPEQAEEVQAVVARMTAIDAKLEAAGERVEAYLQEECGIQIDEP